MTNKVEAYFALKGDNFDPDEFSKRSGLTPTDVFRNGEPRSYGRSYKFNKWKISTGWIVGDVLLIDEIVDQLIERMEGSADCIAATVSEYELYAVLEVVLHVSMDETLSTPSLGFSSKTIAFLNKVKAIIDVDIYRN